MYDVAISFAGEDRELASTIAFKLKNKGVLVFYDEYEQAVLLGECLTEYLTDIYKNKAKYCIVIVSSSYVAKRWTRHEWKAAQARAFESIGESYILPLRVDNSELPGLLPTIGYLDVNALGLDRCVDLLHERISSTTAFNKALREAVLLTQNGEIVVAIETLEKARNYHPEFNKTPEALKHLANLYISNASPEKALVLFELAAAVVPEDADSYMLAGICALRSGEFKKAESHMRECLKRSPNNVTASIDLKLAKLWGALQRIPFMKKLIVMSMPTNVVQRNLTNKDRS